MLSSKNMIKVGGAATIAGAGALVIKMILSSAEKSLAPEEPESDKIAKFMETMKDATSVPTKTAHQTKATNADAAREAERGMRLAAEQANAGSQDTFSHAEEDVEKTARQTQEALQESTEQAMEALQEASRDIASQGEQMRNAAKESAMQTKSGLLGTMRRNSKMIWGVAGGTVTLLGLISWKRRRKSAVAETSDTIKERLSDIVGETADLLKGTKVDVRDRAIEELEKRIEKLRS